MKLMKSVRCRACGCAHAEAVTCHDCQRENDMSENDEKIAREWGE